MSGGHARGGPAAQTEPCAPRDVLLAPLCPCTISPLRGAREERVRLVVTARLWRPHLPEGGVDSAPPPPRVARPKWPLVPLLWFVQTGNGRLRQGASETLALLEAGVIPSPATVVQLRHRLR